MKNQNVGILEGKPQERIGEEIDHDQINIKENAIKGIDKSTVNRLVEEKQIDEVSFIQNQLEQMVLSMQNVIGLLLEKEEMVHHENIEGIVQSLIESEEVKTMNLEPENKNKKDEQNSSGNQQSQAEKKEHSRNYNHLKQQHLKQAIEDKQMITVLNSYQNIAFSIDRLPTLNMRYQEEKEHYIALMEEYHQTSKILNDEIKSAKQIQTDVRTKLKRAYDVLFEDDPNHINTSH